jgi:hypothetical protein
MKRRVILRNGLRALISDNPVIALNTAFALQGQTETGQLELWTADGHWREDKTPHDLDIVRGLFVELSEEEKKGAA